jgi:hypothetical protein
MPGKRFDKSDAQRTRLAGGHPLGAPFRPLDFQQNAACIDNFPAALSFTPRGKRWKSVKPSSLSKSWICRDSAG